MVRMRETRAAHRRTGARVKTKRGQFGNAIRTSPADRSAHEAHKHHRKPHAGAAGCAHHERYGPYEAHRGDTTCA